MNILNERQNDLEKCMMNKYQLIIFDLDDTLFNHEWTEKNAVSYACTNQHIAFDTKIFSIYKMANNLAKKDVPDYLFNLQLFRKTRIHFFFNMLGLNDYDEIKFLDDYLLYSKRGILLDGVEETLRCIQAVKVIATNGADYPRLDKIQNSPLYPLITDFYSSERLGVAKPDNRFYQLILEDQAIQRNKVLVVGDKYEIDIIPAINLGLDACWFNWKNNVESNISNKVQVIYKFSDLLKIVK